MSVRGRICAIALASVASFSYAAMPKLDSRQANANTLHASAMTTLLPTPPAPALSITPGGAMIPHADYVRITYVSPRGETPASGEMVLSAGYNTLTVVHSPPAEPGASGYNVYAVKNNGDNGAGHVRQNATPIAIGTDYTEPSTGWVLTGASVPTGNSAVIAIPAISMNVAPSGGYIEAPAVNGTRAALLLPSNDAPGTTQVRLTASAGLPPGLPGPSDVAGGSDHSIVLHTIGVEFDHAVDLVGYPTFKFTVPRGTHVDAPYLLELYDGVSRSRIATYTASYLSALTFESDFRTVLHTLANRPYYAEIVGNAPYALIDPIGEAPHVLVFSSPNGSSASIDLPKATVTKELKYDVLTSKSPPVGLPPITRVDVRRVLSYTNIMVTGTARYAEPVTLTITVPSTYKGAVGNLRLAAYDSQFSLRGWSPGIAPSKIVDGKALIYSTSLPGLIGWRRYGIAFYESEIASHEPVTATRAIERVRRADRSPVIAILGDSFSRLTIIPPSGVGCTPDWRPLPDCQYSADPARNWPGVLAEITGDDVVNFSMLGTETTADSFAGESMLKTMVPQIPTDADVVVCQCGMNDLARNPNVPSTNSRAAEITKAILERAPRARIVYLGVRCWTACAKPSVDAWNGIEKQLAIKYGAFVDLASIAPDGASAAFPDGTHPSPAAARTVASKIAGALASFNLEGR